MNFLYKFFNKYHIENITLYYIFITSLVSAFAITVSPEMGLLTPDILHSENWIHILLFPFRVSSSFFGNPWIGLFIYMYFLYFLGTLLDNAMGTPNYNIYLILSIVLVTFASVLSTTYVPLLSIDSHYIYFSIFLAVAYKFPDMEIYLFFILPVKIKWLGWLNVIFIIWERTNLIIQTHSILPLLGVVLGLGALFLFFGKEIWYNIKNKYSGNTRKAPFKVKKDAFHKCYICGITELDDPSMEFRYCIDCSDHEYCSKHLSEHNHIQ